MNLVQDVSVKSEQKKILLFFLFSSLWTSLLETFFNIVMEEVSTTQIEHFEILLTTIKAIMPIFQGFIIDHIQFSMNLNTVYIYMMLLSQIYFCGYFIQEVEQIQYLLFAVAFQTIVVQGQRILILSSIAKIWPQRTIPYNFGLILMTYYSSKILIFIIIKINQNIEVPNKKMYLYVDMVLLLFLIPQICMSQHFFPKIKKLGIQRYSQLHLSNPEDQVKEKKIKQFFLKENLLVTLKQVLSSNPAVIGVISGILIAACQVWFIEQDKLLKLFFPQITDENVKNYTLFLSLAFYSISIVFIIAIQRTQLFNLRKFQTLNTISSVAILSFMLAALVALMADADNVIREFLYINICIILQFVESCGFLTGYSIIGQRVDLIRVMGFNFGIFSMFLNGFQIWSLVCLAQRNNQSLLTLHLLNYLFLSGFFAILAIILTKIVIFYDQKQNLDSQSKVALQQYEEQKIIQNEKEFDNFDRGNISI